MNISTSFTLTTAGTPPAWLDAAMVPTYRLVGYNWPAGPAPIVTPILGQTSAADDAFYMATGKWPAWVVAGGSCANEILNASRNSNFSALATDFTAGSNCTVSAASGALVLTSNGSVGNQFAQLDTAFIRAGGVRLGSKVRVVGTVSTNTTGGTIRIQDRSGVLAYALITGTGSFDVTIDITGSFWLGGFLLLSSVQTTSVTSFTCTSLIIYPLGALSLPSVQPINVIDDVSGIGGNQGQLLGCTAVTDKTNWRISVNTWTSGNQQILAGSILDSTKHIIDQVEQSTAGTPTTTIGSASAGSQYKASGALAAGINPTTLVTRKLASNDVWVNSNSTAVVRTTITGHIAT